MLREQKNPRKRIRLTKLQKQAMDITTEFISEEDITTAGGLS